MFSNLIGRESMSPSRLYVLACLVAAGVSIAGSAAFAQSAVGAGAGGDVVGVGGGSEGYESSLVELCAFARSIARR